MTLTEIMDTIISSSKEDWHKMACWGGGSGPSYRDKFEFYYHYEGQPNVLHSVSHGMVASYKPDLSITLAWGLTANDNFKEPWANKFPDPKASSHHADIFFNNALVYRELYVVVDGGRAKLPVPKSREELIVPKGYSSFVKLLDEIDTYISQYDQYFSQEGFKTSDNVWPEL